MGNPFEFRVSLRILHPHLSPTEISSELMMAPRYSWTAGEPRTTPRGAALEGNHRESYCTFELGRGEDGELADFLSRAVEELTQRADFFRSLRATGGSAQFYVFWYPNGDTGEVFVADLMMKMAKLGIDFGLNVYEDQSRSGG